MLGAEPVVIGLEMFEFGAPLRQDRATRFRRGHRERHRLLARCEASEHLVTVRAPEETDIVHLHDAGDAQWASTEGTRERRPPKKVEASLVGRHLRRPIVAPDAPGVCTNNGVEAEDKGESGVSQTVRSPAWVCEQDNYPKRLGRRSRRRAERSDD